MNEEQFEKLSFTFNRISRCLNELVEILEIQHDKSFKLEKSNGLDIKSDTYQTHFSITWVKHGWETQEYTIGLSIDFPKRLTDDEIRYILQRFYEKYDFRKELKNLLTKPKG